MSKEKQLEIIGDELDSLMQRVTANHIRAGQKASGRTLQSIRKQISDAGGVLLGRAYFGVLETGRKPGPVPGGFRFVILKWMKESVPPLFRMSESRAPDGSRSILHRKEVI